VQDVHGNMDVSDELMDEASAWTTQGRGRQSRPLSRLAPPVLDDPL